jgi:hypothetical protein
VEFDIARLHGLCSSPIGGLLLIVLSHWDVDSGLFGKPTFQVLASPAVATPRLFSSSERPGINLSEAWDLTASPFDAMPMADATCPFLLPDLPSYPCQLPLVCFSPFHSEWGGSCQCHLHRSQLAHASSPLSPCRVFPSSSRNVLENQSSYSGKHDSFDQSVVVVTK